MCVNFISLCEGQHVLTNIEDPLKGIVWEKNNILSSLIHPHVEKEVQKEMCMVAERAQLTAAEENKCK